MDNKRLLRYLRNKDEKGIEYFLIDYKALIRYVASPIVKNSQDVEECVSEVAMRVWDKIDTYDERKSSFTTWLTVITRNTALNKVRKKQEATKAEEINQDLVSALPTPEEEMLAKERRKMIINAVNALPLSEKVLFYRQYYYMQSTAQIAAELGLSERAVEGRLYRIKKKLRIKLGGEIDG